jgi:Na+-driven multidrug efflux pump
VVLNLVLVIGMGLDVEGVAIATIVAQYLSAAAVLWILFSPRQEYGLRVREIKLHGDIFKKTVSIGLPCGINGILHSATNVLLQSTINSFDSANIIAGNTAATDINNISYLVNTAFSSATVSFAGQCYGAKKYSRVDKVLRCSLIASTGILTAVAILVTLIPRTLISIFNAEPAVIEAGMPRLLICTWGYVLYAVADMFLGCLRGMKKTTVPGLMNVFTICVPRILWVYFVYPLLPQGTASIFLCYPISYLISIVAYAAYYFRWRKVLDRKGDEVFDPVTA